MDSAGEHGWAADSAGEHGWAAGSAGDEYDVIVIGAGPAGEEAAGRLADGGLQVAIVERELIGGECSYWGCIPSKTLIRPGDVLAAAQRAPGAAEAITGPVDANAAFKQRDYMTSDWHDAGQVPWLEDKGVALVRGHGRLDGERTVTVTPADGGPRHLAARRAVVLATGTGAAMPPIPGLAEARPWDNRTATETHTVPRRFIAVGGGAIGCELAQAFRRLGSAEVTVVEGAPRLLAREEPFAGEEVAKAFADEDIRVLTNATVESVRRDDGIVTARLADGSELPGDEILIAVGRRPSTRDLGLDSVGLEPGKYVEVDDSLRATKGPGRWLFAVGDCNGRALFTHMGKYHARIAADVILGHDIRDRSSQRVIPRVTFTDPQVCAVGLTEEQARSEYGERVRCVTYGTGDVAGSYVLGNGLGGTSKLVIDESRRVLVGATFVGSGVQELLHSATVAIAGEVTLDNLWHAVPTFPTVSEVWLRLLQAYGL